MGPKTLFDPCRIARAMSTALKLDLGSVPQMRHLALKKRPGSEVFAQNQIEDFLRKSEFDLSPDSLPSHEARVERAVEMFLDVSEHVVDANIDLMTRYSSNYRKKVTKNWTRDDFLSRDLDRIKMFLGQVLGDFELDGLFSACRHGAGVTLGLKFASTDLEDKWKYPLTGTPEAIQLFRLYEEFDPLFAAALAWHNRFSTKPKFKVVTASRTSGVPKNSRIARLVAVEATLNMFFQQGYLSLMTEQLRPWVDIVSAQFDHHYLAWLGSLTGKLSTFDMRSASDTVARMLVKLSFPSTWYAGLNLVSMKETTMHLGAENLLVVLPMFSTMGNATTFPIETLIFYSILVTLNSAYPSERSLVPTECWNKQGISVFGDDCIVPSHLNEQFLQLVTDCGFLVNDEKSFYEDNGFRESCGADYLVGHNIRSYYLSEPHNNSVASQEAWLYSVMNSVFKKLIYNFGRLHYIYMCRAFLRVCRLIFRSYNIEVKYVPNYFPDDSGLHWMGDQRISLAMPDCRLSPVRTDEQGSSVFFALRFNYTDGPGPSNELRYATHLRTMSPQHWWLRPLFSRVLKWKGSSDGFAVATLHTTWDPRWVAAFVKASANTSPRMSVTSRKRKLQVTTQHAKLQVTTDTFADRTTKKIGAYQKKKSKGMMPF